MKIYRKLLIVSAQQREYAHSHVIQTTTGTIQTRHVMLPNKKQTARRNQQTLSGTTAARKADSFRLGMVPAGLRQATLQLTVQLQESAHSHANPTITGKTTNVDQTQEPMSHAQENRRMQAGTQL